jgi:formylglycine-generating enzyme required for sulfatase activity
LIEVALIDEGQAPVGGIMSGVPGAARDVAPFRLSVREVAVSQYRAFVDAGGYTTPDYWSPEGLVWRAVEQVHAPLDWDEQKDGGLPVTGVSYFEAEAFAKWAGGRLPSELEWEAALRGAAGRIYPWGDAWDAALCNTADSGKLELKPAGAVSANPAGVQDLIGSLWEWTGEVIADYPDYGLPPDYLGSMHVLRGGSYWDREWQGTRFLPAMRLFQDGGYRQRNVGIRLAYGAEGDGAEWGLKPIAGSATRVDDQQQGAQP